MVVQKFMVDNQIITLKDNLFHPYFSYISVAKDNISPVGICKIEMPYMQEALDYWMKYDDIVVVSFSVKETNNEEYLSSLEVKSKIKNDEYNYSFVGHIHKVKRKGNKVIIYLEDIGWKFEQKVPNDFRKMYVAGQHLDDVFQAICEFTDIRYCHSIEHLNKYTFGNDGYTIQKDGNTIEEVQNIFELIQENDTGIVDQLDNPYHENEGLFDYDQENNISTEQGTEQILGDNTNPEAPQNNSKKQEEGLQEKFKKHEEDFKQKIQDLFIGNKYYDSKLSSPILNYGGITIDTTDSSGQELTPLDNLDNSDANNSTLNMRQENE